MNCTFPIAILVIATTSIPHISAAEEQSMKFRLVTRDVSATALEAPSAPGTSLSVVEAAGTALFEDGRIANKTFVLSSEDSETEGKWVGYSVYVFENGDKLNMRFVGGADADRVGGDYEVLSGTGAFDGATGTGKFDLVPTEWEGAALWDAEFLLQMPES